MHPARLAAWLIIIAVILLGTAATIRLLAPATTGPGAARMVVAGPGDAEELIAGCIRLAREAAGGG